MAEERLRIILDATGGPGVQAQLRGVQAAINTVTTAASRISTVLGVAAVGSIGAFVRSSLESTAALVDNADKLGVNVERYQEYEAAARAANVSSETFASAMENLALSVAKAGDASSDSARMLRLVGVDAQAAARGTIPLDEVLRQVQAGMQDLTSDTDRLLVSQALLGKAGKEMALFMGQGADALDRAAASAREAGLVIEESTARQAKQLADDFQRVGAEATVAGQRLAVAFGPVLLGIFEGVAEKAGQVERAIRDIFDIEGRGQLEGQLADVEARLARIAQMQLEGRTGPAPIGTESYFLERRAEELRERLRRNFDNVASGVTTTALTPEQRAREAAASLAERQAAEREAAEAAKRGHAEAKRAAEEYLRVVDQISETLQRSAERRVLLQLESFDRDRAQAAIELSSSIREVESAELRAVESARGNQQKIVEAHRVAGEAIEQITLEYQARVVQIDRNAAEERARLERERAQAVQSFLDTIPERDSDLFDTAQQEALDLANIVETGLGQALASFGNESASAFSDFVTGSKTAGEAAADFAEGVIKSLADVATQLLVNIALQKILGSFSGGGAVSSGTQAFLDALAAGGMASGGVVTKPTLTWIGEGGEPEAVVPLSKAKDVGFGGGPEINVTTVVNVGAGGATSTESKASGDSGGMARVLSGLMVEVIRKELRPGGVIEKHYRARR